MSFDDIQLIKGPQIATLLEGRETDIIDVIGEAYRLHAKGLSNLPHSAFLQFPDDEVNRIIALPAYLGGSNPVAGIKWISSFPGNHLQSFARASAVIILNSMITGRPKTILEGSIISAKRTAASGALAARLVLPSHKGSTVGVIGCGVINLETVRFLSADRPSIQEVMLYDLNEQQQRSFAQKLSVLPSSTRISFAASAADIFECCDLVTVATTEIKPHLNTAIRIRPGSMILHISLRDFEPDVILSCDNIVDDIEHVCRHRTSVQLAAELQGSRNFIKATIGSLLNAENSFHWQPEKSVIFSPFGLGILDLALATFVGDLAEHKGVGLDVAGFFPPASVSG